MNIYWIWNGSPIFFIASLDYQRLSTKTWTRKQKRGLGFKRQPLESVQPVAQIWPHGNQQPEMGKTFHMTARLEIVLVVKALWYHWWILPKSCFLFFNVHPFAKRGKIGFDPPHHRYPNHARKLANLREQYKAVEAAHRHLWISRICGHQRLGFKGAQHVFW